LEGGLPLKLNSFQLHPEVYRGTLTYRAKGTSKRIPYVHIKAGLGKQKSIIELDVSDWL